MRTRGNWICWSRKELACREAATEHRKSRPTVKSAIGFMGRVYQPRPEIHSPRCTINEALIVAIAWAAVSEQAKDGFDGDPRGYGSLRSIAGRNEFPAAHGFHCAFVQAKADAFDDANILRTAIRAYENLQRH
jgi:hypothetical protein